MADNKVGLQVVKKDEDDLTVEKLKRLFPKKKSTITEKTVEMIRAANTDPEFDGSRFLDELAHYQGCMVRNSASMEQYIDALRFCAYLESEGDNVTEAYKKTFINREFVQNRLNVPTSSVAYAELTSAASRFRRSPLVVDILTQADVPLYLMFQGFRYKAVQVLADRMENAKFDKDKISAAKALLENVKPPENIKMELDIGVKENNALQDLNDQLAEIANRQLHHLNNGTATLHHLGGLKPKEEIIDVEEV
jgi:hypothetical protein